jgi:hypothetical protein
MLPILMLLGVSGCQSSPAISLDPCAGWKVIRPTHADMLVISDALVAQIDNHDSYGVKRCGWKE